MHISVHFCNYIPKKKEDISKSFIFSLYYETFGIAQK